LSDVVTDDLCAVGVDATSRRCCESSAVVAGGPN